MSAAFKSFAGLPPDLQARIRSEIMPSDPEQWVGEPMAALGGRSFLATLNSAGGAEEIDQYFDRIASAEASWTSAVRPPVEPSSDRAAPARRWRALLLAGAVLAIAAIAAPPPNKVYFTAAAVVCYLAAFVSRRMA